MAVVFARHPGPPQVFTAIVADGTGEVHEAHETRLDHIVPL